MDNFLQKNFTKISLLHESEITKIWLVKKIDGEENFVLKEISRVNLPYSKMLKLEQKNLPKIFYVAETESETFVLEEFLRGKNLLEYIKLHGEFSEKIIIKFALELCDCLEFLHSKKILHRDIKPSNLFLTEGGDLKLIDFDAGRVEKFLQENDTQIIGTPGFAPPEQYGFRQTDKRADIYALGLTLKLLLGFENYRGILSKILDKCTEFDPSRRFNSAQELKRAIIFQKNFGRLKKFFLPSFIAAIFFAVMLINISKIESPELPAENTSEVEEKISAPEKISESEKNISVAEDKKIFQFPEIKIPDQNISEQKNSVPQKNISPPEKNSDKKIPDKKIYKNFVKVSYYLNGNRANAWVDKFNQDITNSEWDTEINNLKNFEILSQNSVKFPAWNIEIKVENFTEKNFLNPALEIIFDDNSRVEKKILRGENIPSGGEKIFKVPLNQFTITDIHAAGKYFQSKHNLKIKFTGSGAKIHGSAMTFGFVFKL